MSASAKTPPPSVLVVDDEPHALELLTRSLRKHAKVETAGSAEEAWERFRASDAIDIVISDQRMPGMSGVDLLGRIAETHPSVGRILLTGYSDLDATVAAINRGRVHAYLHKPCSPPELLATVKSVGDRVALARDNERLRGALEVVDAGAVARESATAAASRALAALDELERAAASDDVLEIVRKLCRDLVAAANGANDV